MHPDPIAAVAYLRTQRPDADGDLARQREEVEQLAADRGWQIVAVHEDRGSTRAVHRPGLDAATRMLDDGHAAVLVTTRLDRLTRSRSQMVALFERARSNGWDLVECQHPFDTTTPLGRGLVDVLVAFQQLDD